MADPTTTATIRRRCVAWLTGRCHGDQDCRCIQIVPLPRDTPKRPVSPR